MSGCGNTFLDGCTLFNVPIKPSTLTPYEIIKYQTLYGIQAGNNILAYTHFGFLRICNFRSGIYIYTPIENYPNRCTCLIFNIPVMYLTGWCKNKTNLSIIEAIFKNILKYIQPYTIITVMGYSVASTKKVNNLMYK